MLGAEPSLAVAGDVEDWRPGGHIRDPFALHVQRKTARLEWYPNARGCQVAHGTRIDAGWRSERYQLIWRCDKSQLGGAAVPIGDQDSSVWSRGKQTHRRVRLVPVTNLSGRQVQSVDRIDAG